LPTFLGQPYALEWRGDPPHMLPRDIPVWYRFLEKYGAPFIKIYYDVRLGGPFLTPEQEKDPFMRDWQYLSSKRMDVLAELRSEIWIIEVVHQAGMRSIGQCESYLSLWKMDPKIDKPAIKVLVAETIDEDLLSAAASLGIVIFIVDTTAIPLPRR